MRTSPELYHKRLLAGGALRIFEIGKCFRKGERGALHHPEYTLLEWYRAEGDYRSMLADTQALLSALLPAFAGAPSGLSAPWVIRSIEEVYLEYAGWNPLAAFDADRFDLDMVEKIEPNLPQHSPVVLMDYPAECCALARLKPDRPAVAERWELYLGGIEIANAYSELTDPVEMRERFDRWGRARARSGREVYPLDERFIRSLERMPPSGGCALGVDRLLMILTGASSLDEVLPFRDG